MTQLAKHYTNEETGISYTLSPEGYYLPDLIVPEEPPELVELAQGRYALMRRHYLKNYRQGLFVTLLTQGKLTAHLAEIQEAAFNRMELISRQMAQAEGVTEQLKAENQMLWIQRMTNIRNRVDEIIREELIYS